MPVALGGLGVVLIQVIGERGEAGDEAGEEAGEAGAAPGQEEREEGEKEGEVEGPEGACASPAAGDSQEVEEVSRAWEVIAGDVSVGEFAVMPGEGGGGEDVVVGPPGPGQVVGCPAEEEEKAVEREEDGEGAVMEEVADDAGFEGVTRWWN